MCVSILHLVLFLLKVLALNLYQLFWGPATVAITTLTKSSFCFKWAVLKFGSYFALKLWNINSLKQGFFNFSLRWQYYLSRLLFGFYTRIACNWWCPLTFFRGCVTSVWYITLSTRSFFGGFCCLRAGFDNLLKLFIHCFIMLEVFSKNCFYASCLD
jgi:hypothetical protein